MTAATTTGPASSARPTGPAGPTGRGHQGPWVARIAVVTAAIVAAVVAHGNLLPVLGLVAALVAVLIAARPETAALVAVGLIFSNATVIAVHDHGIPGAVALLVPILLLVTAGYHVFAHRQPILIPRAALWMVAFLVVQMVGALLARDPATSVATVQTFLLEGVVLFLLLTNAVRGWRLVRLAAIVLVVVAGFLGTLSLFQEVTGADHQDFAGFSTMSNAVINRASGGGSARHAGPIGEQNRWAQSLAVTVPIAVALGWKDRSRAVRLLAKVSGVGIVVGIVLTYSRGSVVGLVLMVLIAVIVRWVRLRTALIVAGVAVGTLLVFAPTFANRATTVVTASSSVRSTTGGATAQDGSFANRSTEATAAIAVFLHHPVVGVGTGLFPTYFQDQARAQGADRIVGVDREAHSLYLGLAAETGLLGLVTFACFAGSLLTALGKVRRRYLTTDPDAAALATGFGLAIVTYLTTGLFLHFAYIRYFWLLAGLAAAMGMVNDAGTPAVLHPHPPKGRSHDVHSENPSPVADPDRHPRAGGDRRAPGAGRA
ncbi:O-antigen ligase family protein [Aquihabitans sp. McL0605]|uniref:O-antigen ligase family protein n=1 Tax=Aquihabitans sp. McL0605 TaxID=3415671 RepID=UPI003CF6A515